MTGMRTTTRFAVGDRVVLRGTHFYSGQAGKITNNPGKVFNGWTVRLDNGRTLGVHESQMLKESTG